MSELRISIAGCGWLGMQAGKHFVKKGFSVSGSTTCESKISRIKDAGIQPYLIDFSLPDGLSTSADFFKADILLISISPSKTKGKYAEMIRRICKNTSAKIIFISSTGVYPPAEGIYTERSSLLPEEENEMVRAENRVSQNSDNWIIFRCAGLFGQDRDPGRFLAGKTSVAAPLSPVNIVHGEDVIACILGVLPSEISNEIFNICSPLHPKRGEFYTLSSLKSGLVPPAFDAQSPSPQRIIDSNKIINKLSIEFEKSAAFLGYI